MGTRRRWLNWVFLPRALCLIAAVALVAYAADTGAASATNATATGNLFQWRPFLAPFHSVVLHFPIGFVTMACILEVYFLRRPSIELRRIITLVIQLSLASGVVTAAFGIMRAGGGGYELKTLDLHRWFGASIPFLTLVALIMRLRLNRDGNLRFMLYSYRIVLGATLAVLVIAGHLGGNLTHGSKYLVQHAPPFVKALLDEAEPQPTAATQRDDGTNKVFLENIQPILAAKCYRCHGEEKQKGEYRLDQQEIAFKGGESGLTAIKPKEPLQSHLVRLILLPRDDDDAMPPEGKEPLTPDEILQIIHWIQKGAAFAENPRHAAITATPEKKP